ncbi:MAG: DUF4974 domain-containing protein [Bacteroidales bacterium]|jgi:ferric-dicitrate binding protein FerR (iron transport regulator)|nr:DUF4974 domain-containing protein [Bacteroidales bacterium]
MNRQTHIEALIAGYLNGSITDGERRELAAWLDISDENRKIFGQMCEIWRASQYADGKFAFDAHVAFARFKKENDCRQVTRKHVIKLPYRWAAAVVLLSALGGAMFQRWILPHDKEPAVAAYQEIRVPYGARSKVRMPDGSNITLNAGTVLRYRVDFGKERRDLWLDGEAYFVVQKSATPFVVHSGNVEIQAVGTQFNVRAYSSEKNVETTLVEGKVAVYTYDAERNNPAKTVTLLPNQKLVVSKNEPERKTLQTAATVRSEPPSELPVQEILHEEVDPLPDISWKDNEWVIYRENLENLAVKLERRFDVTIQFKDPHLKSFRYNGTLPDESLEQVLDVMRMVSPIQYTVKGKTVIFSENSKFKN